MNWKEFLKPDWRKILVFVISIIMGIVVTHPLIYPEYSYSFPFLPLPFETVEIRAVPCPPGAHERIPGVIPDCMESVIILQNILLNLVSYYLISCLIVWIYDKVRKK
ncbi:MAG: hypothetical protein QMD36_02685 [Candidatus Aenigmarchaeota archaeon]|nr:hypothetical protein [Candidatus Aenigmarchaeota archaeon]